MINDDDTESNWSPGSESEKSTSSSEGDESEPGEEEEEEEEIIDHKIIKNKYQYLINNNNNKSKWMKEQDITSTQLIDHYWSNINENDENIKRKQEKNKQNKKKGKGVKINSLFLSLLFFIFQMGNIISVQLNDSFVYCKINENAKKLEYKCSDSHKNPNKINKDLALLEERVHIIEGIGHACIKTKIKLTTYYIIKNAKIIN